MAVTSYVGSSYRALHKILDCSVANHMPVTNTLGIASIEGLAIIICLLLLRFANIIAFCKWDSNSRDSYTPQHAPIYGIRKQVKSIQDIDLAISGYRDRRGVAASIYEHPRAIGGGMECPTFALAFLLVRYDRTRVLYMLERGYGIVNIYVSMFVYRFVYDILNCIQLCILFTRLYP